MSLISDPVFTVVLSTYNRGELLVDAVRSLIALDPASPPHEIIIVDNNSRDNTRGVVESLIPESGGRLRYLFEGKQGLSHARNAGVAASRGRIVAFTDDDVRASPDWLIALGRAFDEHPDADYAGGRVLPMWPLNPPEWLIDWFWSPLALVDYGPEGRYVSADDRDAYITLVGANLAVRRAVFDDVGGFDPRFQHERGSVSSCEDHEFELRLVNAGKRGWYEPSAVIRAEVQPKRLEKAYHRKWSFDHGRGMARMAPAGHWFDGRCTFTPKTPTTRHLLGAPLRLYHDVLSYSWGYLRSRVKRDRRSATWFEFKAFEHLGMLHFDLTTGRNPDARLTSGAAPQIPAAREVPAATSTR
jgi:GT2 family glycosyltransferase